ncbi:FkbM family methyltransferase [Methylosinus sporium]|uniref:FkbM family methyltransferase n=1 Tax=Methylosinus sporium TaxID=428 RepID=A0A549SS45_METSR|nr:FkbM family methyltransferase [Methylosinus sporium]TRL32456.1 FkbM family methyltransferase [Methylosinus sporium]
MHEVREISESIYDSVLKSKFRRLSEILENPFFLQVGACDGVTSENMRDVFNETDWSAVMLEPLPDMFAKLQVNWAHKPKFQLVNAALAPYDGTAEIRRIPPEDVRASDAWEWGISSLNGVDSSFGRPGFHKETAEFLTSRSRLEQVKTISFETLKKNVGIKRIDYIQIDTEGYDRIVMEEIDLVRFRPFLIQCEIYNLSTVDRAKLFGYLQRHGYSILYWTFDLIAYHL